jgi:hypothetical protein
MIEDQEACRLCGEATKIENLSTNLKDDLGGFQFGNLVEYYCRLSLGE